MAGPWMVALGLAAAAAGVHLHVHALEGEGELERADALAAQGAAQARVFDAGPSAADLRRLAGLEARGAAAREEHVHVRIDLAEGTGVLHDGPYPLRRFPVWIGASDALHVPSALEPGVHRITAVWGAHPPPDLRTCPDASAAPWPGEAPPDAWDVAQVGVTLLYSASPPLPAVVGDALPDTVRLGEMDLAAILPSLPVGTPVYVW